jgi:hypothetical protein
MNMPNMPKAIDAALDGRRLYVLEYLQGFSCDSVMVFDADLQAIRRLGPTALPRSGDLVLIGDRHHLESVARLDVERPRRPSPGADLTLSIAMAPLQHLVVMPLDLLRPEPDDATAIECGRLVRNPISDFEMTGRLMLLGGQRLSTLWRQVHQQITDELFDSA